MDNGSSYKIYFDDSSFVCVIANQCSVQHLLEVKHQPVQKRLAFVGCELPILYKKDRPHCLRLVPML